LKAGPCTVVQRKTPATDGYDAVQLGLQSSSSRSGSISRDRAPEKGRRGRREVLREFRLGPGDDDLKAGDKVLVSEFKPNEKVDVIGVSKGRGFAGVVKRHHFRGGEGTHGSMFTARLVRSALRAFPRACSLACAWAAIWATSR
jgi:large subunit ribosomal protein L3